MDGVIIIYTLKKKHVRLSKLSLVFVMINSIARVHEECIHIQLTDLVP